MDRAQAVAHVFKLARIERDAWLNWPARISGQMASALGVDAHTMHVTLEAAVRGQVQVAAAAAEAKTAADAAGAAAAGAAATAAAPWATPSIVPPPGSAST